MSGRASIRWAVGWVLVVSLAIIFVMLGLWQLRRADERSVENEIGHTRFTAEPLPLRELLAGSGEEIETLQYRRTTVEGVFDADSEVLIRSQVYRDTAGFHVVTPLVTSDGQAVLVNRGWVPLLMDDVPVGQAPPPEGRVRVEGWVHMTQLRSRFGPADPAEGRLSVMARVDIGRIGEQVPYELAPVYVVKLAEADEELPVPLRPPGFDDPGPHLGYAIQWFGFAAIVLVGFGALHRRSLRVASVSQIE